jgi:ABC-type bacteriocin/lantibiotic exporter with double-glycine peptidase domain
MATTAPPAASDPAAADVSGVQTRPEPPPLRRLVHLLKPERDDLLTVFIFGILAGILYLATPLAVDVLVNNLAFGAAEGVYVQALVVLSLGLFGFLILLGLVRGAQYYVTELIQRRLFVRLTADLSYRLPRVRMEALDSKLGPDLVNRFFDVVTVQKSAALILLDGINLGLGAFIGLLILGFYHPFLLVFDLVLIAYVAVILLVLGRGAIDTSVEESYAKHRVASWLEQVALFPYLFKSDGASHLAAERANALAEQYLDARSRHWRIVFRQILNLLGLQAVASAALLGLGGFLVLNAELTLGQLVAAEIIVSAIVANLASLGKHIESFYDAVAAVDKIGYVVDLPVEREGGEAPVGDRGNGGASVEVSRLRFGYQPSRPILEGVSMHLSPGERVALVGAAGFGTSTLMDILIGHRIPQGGTVRVEGVDVRDWDLSDLRRVVTLVRGQDLVATTVLENVRFGRTDLSRQKVREALDRVGLLEDIMRLPDGIDTRLMVGGRPLSASQRSRLIVARAIIDSPRLLLLDENLENLEARTFTELTDFIFDRENDWTLLVATRDPSLLQRCDRFIDMATFGPMRTGVTG